MSCQRISNYADKMSNSCRSRCMARQSVVCPSSPHLFIFIVDHRCAEAFPRISANSTRRWLRSSVRRYSPPLVSAAFLLLLGLTCALCRKSVRPSLSLFPGHCINIFLLLATPLRSTSSHEALHTPPTIRNGFSTSRAPGGSNGSSKVRHPKWTIIPGVTPLLCRGPTSGSWRSIRSIGISRSASG